MKHLPSKSGWARMGILVCAAGVMMFPVHDSSAVRGSVPVPIQFDTLHATHGTWAVAGIVGGQGAVSSPLGAALLAKVPALGVEVAQVHGRLFPDEVGESSARDGDIRYANLVADYTAASVVRRALGEPVGELGTFVTETPADCSWFSQGLREKDVVVSPDGLPSGMFRINSALRSGRSPQRFVVRRGEESVQITVDSPCEEQPLGVDVYANYPPRSETYGSNGSSRGLITALSMMDSFTSGDLTGGKRVTGTGEMFLDGKSGSILGVREKVQGADGRFDVFLVDTDDYDAAKDEAQRLQSAMRVVQADTFGDAIAWLCANGGGADAVCSLPVAH